MRTAETSLPAADKPICHEVIKRHVLCLQELAPGFVPPEPEAAHPPRRQTMAIVCPAEQPRGQRRALECPKCHQNTPNGAQATAAVSKAPTDVSPQPRGVPGQPTLGTQHRSPV